MRTVGSGEGEVDVILGGCSLKIKVEEGASGQGDLVEGVRALERVDILEDNSQEPDDVLCCGGRA